MSLDEFQVLKSAVIELCRGGTISGSITRIQLTGGSNVLRVRGILEDGMPVDIEIESQQWNGIEALIGDPNRYGQCVQYTLNIVVPALQVSKNIDTDLNARLDYIRSIEFCERLQYVVAQAPSAFSEWRRGSESADGVRLIGSYLMGNPEALNMVSKGSGQLPNEMQERRKNIQAIREQINEMYTEMQSVSDEEKSTPEYKRSLAKLDALREKAETEVLLSEEFIQAYSSGLRDAEVRVDNEYGYVTFYEPLLYTGFLDVGDDAGLVVARIKEAIGTCLMDSEFRPGKDIEYADQERFADGSPFWEFVETRFLGSSRRAITVEFSDYIVLQNSNTRKIGLTVRWHPRREGWH